ncbi:MAG: FAD-binding oxidoreductase [Candidatus Marinimicrobia bacterium]|nr:FAD-binding oxidoreductase [Candidatus Neomarinimicrobiota bacterium]
MSLSGWGNYPHIHSNVFDYANETELLYTLQKHCEIIPFGNGRSYGDSALNKNIINTKKCNYFLSFDEGSGVLHCQAGVLLSEILEVFVPKGWFLSVTPGTKFITIGGAISSDVHGKNHHIAGSFSDTTLSFRIAMPNGKIVECSRNNNEELFRATCGGMGLTGVIIDAKIKLQPIKSTSINQITIKTKNLNETFEAFERYLDYTYSVAWIDCLSKGDKIGKCLLMVGEHGNDGHLEYKNETKLFVPFNLPSLTLNRFSVSTFNMLYYGKAKSGVSEQKVSIDSFFYPLDAIAHWNRIYGKKGLTQYQFVLPKEKSYEGLKKILGKIADSGKGSFLAVLKLFGKGNKNYLSFPIEGYTLALDFKIEPDLFPLLDELDKVVLDYGGRFYLAKDCRLTKETFEQGYPQIETFRAFRDQHNLNGTLQSLQSKRVRI